jgi:membrane-anchored glycerophosphoryl diester phosphodiesterase (GDPDase)
MTTTMTTAMTKDELRAGLSEFYGSDTLYRHFLNQCTFTEGVKFLSDNAKSYWMIDAIFSYLPETKLEYFQTWIFRKIGDSIGALYMSDGNDKEILIQKFDFTDFPLDEVKFFLVHNEFGFTLMLPSEY